MPFYWIWNPIDLVKKNVESDKNLKQKNIERKKNQNRKMVQWLQGVWDWNYIELPRQHILANLTSSGTKCKTKLFNFLVYENLKKRKIFSSQKPKNWIFCPRFIIWLLYSRDEMFCFIAMLKLCMVWCLNVQSKHTHTS